MKYRKRRLKGMEGIVEFRNVFTSGGSNGETRWLYMVDRGNHTKPKRQLIEWWKFEYKTLGSAMYLNWNGEDA